MDANVAVALFTKIKNIYETPNSSKFLSFPFFAYNVSPENFNIFISDTINKDSGGLEINKVLANQKEFFHLFDDLIKVQESFKTSGTLGSSYHEILAEASFKDNDSETDVLKKITKLSKKLITSKGYTKKYQAYFDCQKLYYEAQTKSRNESNNENLKIEFEQANINWLIKGFKNYIQDILKQLLSLNNSIDTNLYRTALIDQFSKCSNPIMNNNSMPNYLTTFYSPKNILAPEIKWQTINLFSEFEIKELFNKADNGLKELIGVMANSNIIINLSIDIAYIDIIRDWFDPKLFEKKNWSFADSNKRISNGDVGYIKAILLSKNLKVTYRQKETATPLVMENVNLKEFVKYNRFSVIKTEMAAKLNIQNLQSFEESRNPVTKFETFSHELKINPFLIQDRKQFVVEKKIDFIIEKPILFQKNLETTISISNPIGVANSSIDVIALVCEKIPNCP